MDIGGLSLKPGSQIIPHGGRELNLKAASVGSYGQCLRRPPGSCAQDVNKIKDCGSKCLDSTRVSGPLCGQE